MGVSVYNIYCTFQTIRYTQVHRVENKKKTFSICVRNGTSKVRVVGSPCETRSGVLLVTQDRMHDRSCRQCLVGAVKWPMLKGSYWDMAPGQ